MRGREVRARPVTLHARPVPTGLALKKALLQLKKLHIASTFSKSTPLLSRLGGNVFYTDVRNKLLKRIRQRKLLFCRTFLIYFFCAAVILKSVFYAGFFKFQAYLSLQEGDPFFEFVPIFNDVSGRCWR